MLSICIDHAQSEDHYPHLVTSFQRPDACGSSVQETLLPLRGLANWYRATGDQRVAESVKRAAEFLLERHLLWRKRDGKLIEPEWGGPVDRISYPIRFYDVLSVLLVMAELGLLRDPRCREALDLLEGKRLANGAFPVEWTNVRKADRIETRGTYADWGLRPKRKGNAFVTVDALYVLREAGRNTATCAIRSRQCCLAQTQCSQNLTH